MSQSQSDYLLQKLLACAEPTTAEAEHPDEESLARFTAGDLVGSELDSFAAHLSHCTECREVAAAVLKLDSPSSDASLAARASDPASIVSMGGRRLSVRAWCVAAAASLLVAVGAMLWWPQAKTEQVAYERALERLTAGDFAETRQMVAEAASQGLLSDRLCNLDAQAILGIPGEVALSDNGRLSQFGHDIGGVVARGAMQPAESSLEAAAARLATVDQSLRESALNRGYLLLLQGNYGDAAAVFRATIANHPQDPLAWLGAGLADFLQGDFAAAETAYRKCHELDSRNLSAAINLAMALEELDRTMEARRIWQELLARPDLPKDERTRIELHLQSNL